jgi:archaellum component FlaC
MRSSTFALIILLILLSTSPAGALTQEEPPEEGATPTPLTIQTDKDSYIYGDTLQVEGTSTPEAVIMVQLWKPDGSLAAIAQVEVDEDGKFTATLYRFMAGDLGGKWRVKAYDPVTGNTTEKEITLSLEESDTEPPKLTLEISPEKDSYNTGDRVTFTLKSSEKLLEAPTASLATPCVTLTVRFSPAQGEFEWTASLTLPECSGTYTLKVEAADQVGNLSTATLEFKVEQPAQPPPPPPQPPEEEEWVKKIHIIVENYEVSVTSWSRIVPVPGEPELWQAPQISLEAKNFKLEISASEAQGKPFNLYAVRLEDLETLLTGAKPVEPIWEGEGQSTYQAEIEIDRENVVGGIGLAVENPKPNILNPPAPALTITVTAKIKWQEPKQPSQVGPTALPEDIETRLQNLEAATQKLEANLSELSLKLESTGGKTEGLKQEVTGITETVEKLKFDAATLKKTDADMAQTLKNINEKLAAIDSNLQNINLKISQLQNQVNQLTEAHRIPQMAAAISTAALALAILALITLRKTLKIVKP